MSSRTQLTDVMEALTARYGLRSLRLKDIAAQENKNEGGLVLVLDLAKAFERVSLAAWATRFEFPRRILRVLCGYFEHQRRVQFEGCVAEPLQTITAILSGSKWSCSHSFVLGCRTR